MQLLWFVIFAGIIWFLITQILIPSWKGEKWFPNIGKSQRLPDEIRDVEEELTQKKFKEELERKKNKL